MKIIVVAVMLATPVSAQSLVHCQDDLGFPVPCEEMMKRMQTMPISPGTIITANSISSHFPHCPNGYALVADQSMQPKCAQLPLHEPDY